jgi:hypothetical protein
MVVNSVLQMAGKTQTLKYFKVHLGNILYCSVDYIYEIWQKCSFSCPDRLLRMREEWNEKRDVDDLHE